MPDLASIISAGCGLLLLGLVNDIKREMRWIRDYTVNKSIEHEKRIARLEGEKTARQ